MRHATWLVLGGWLVGLALLLAGCGGSASSAPDEVVAEVGAAKVTKASLGHWARNGTDSSQALDLLISAARTSGQAADLGVGIGAKQAEAQLTALEDDRTLGTSYRHLAPGAPFSRLLQAAGRSHADELWLMQMNLLRLGVEAALRKRIAKAIPDSEVTDFYTRRRERYLEPERIHMEILGSHERSVVVKARREIQAGVDFLAVAKRVSVDTEAPEGLQSFAKGQEEPPFERVVFAAKPGVLSDPEKYRLYYLFKVFYFTPAHQLTLGQAESRVRDEIAATEHQRLSQMLGALEVKWATRTSCRRPYGKQCAEVQ